ncbi:MAG TPA: TonB-dependent receptor [Thermoanaerobaculia bacterium]|jgi:outer membrane receptor protein involved in Fe transport|nr:TonB-dependent receptor [Thermoanaerobaculia bacterium]
MKKWTFILIALVALAPTTLFGQAQTTGSVTGTVLNDAGAPIADAEVTLTSPAIQGDRVTRTGPNGQFTARLLPPGQYTATINSPGLQPAVLSFRVLVGETMPLNVTLYPGDVAGEEIVVLGRVSPLQTPETRQSFDYTTEVEELPIQNRNINNIALSAPNTSFGPNAGQVAIAGAPAFDTVVLLDGAEISDPYFGSGTTVYLEDAIQEVQVLTTGISARYGRFQGGVINAVTKSGGNQYSGTLRTEFDKQSWNEKTPFGEVQANKLNKVYQGTLGGFVIPDRLWFFGGYRTIPETATAFTTNTTLESWTRTTNEDRYQLKLRGAVTPSHTIDASYLKFEAETSQQAGLPAGDLLALGNRLDPREMTSISYQGVFGFNTFADAMYTDKAVQIASGGDPAGGDPFLWASAGNWVYNNHWWDISDPSVRDNKTAALNVSHTRDTGFGTHLLQGGIQWVESTTAGDNKQSATGYNLIGASSAFNPRVVNGTLLFDLNPNAIQRWVASDLKATNNITNTALYLQDSVNWNKFRFDVGVRYDMYKGETTGVQAFDLDFSDFSPRIGVTYNVTPTLQVLGTYGRYVGRFNDNWAGPAAGVSSAPRSIWNYIGPQQLGLNAAQVQAVLRDNQFWQQIGLIGDPAFPTTWVSSDAQSPYSNEWNLSLRSALPRNSGFVSLTYTDRAYKNLMTAFVGLACSDFGRCEGAGDRSPIPGGAFVDTTVWDNDSRAKRDYQGLALQADYRPTTRLTVGGNWTWSETKGNYEGEALNQPASGSVIGFRERAIDTAAAAPYGFLAQDIRHRANAYATYRFDFGRAGDLSTSGIVNYRTGLPFNRVGAVALSAVPQYVTSSGTYTYFHDGRGNNRFDSVWSLDTALRYSVPVVWRFAPFIKLDVRNILNKNTLISYQTTGTSAVVSGVRTWFPSGNGDPRSATYNASCNPDSGSFSPSTACTGFGRVRNETDYQTPRTFLITAGLQF